MVLRETLLVEKLKNGDEKAFREIYDHYHRRLYYFSLRFNATDSAAREIVQEVFVKLWTNRQTLKADLSLGAYLYTIARHLNFKSLQQAARDLIFKQEMIYRTAARYHHVEQDLIYAEYLRIAEDAVEQLSPERKLVFNMSRVEGLTPKEISKRLDISVSTVKNRLVEARKHIKSHLHERAGLPVFILLFFETCFF